MVHTYQQIKNQKVICFVRYKKHIDYENYCGERLLLYVPFENNENTLKHNMPTWQDAYFFHENTIRKNKSKVAYNIDSIWGDFEKVVEQLLNSSIDTFDTLGNDKKEEHYIEQYDLETYLQCLQHSNRKNKISLGF